MIKKLLDKHGRKLIFIAGVAVLLAAAYFLASGIYCFSQNSTSRDSEGYYNTWNIDVHKKDSYAVVLQRYDPDSESRWNGEYADVVKLSVTNNNPEKGVFIGVGEEEDVLSYIGDFNHDEIIGLHIFPMRADYIGYAGAGSPESPASETFWTVTRLGGGTQELVWVPGSDNSSLVLMNADGSAGIDISLDIKTKSTILFLGVVFGLLAGIFLLMLGIMLIHGARRTRSQLFALPLGIGSGRNR